jgi:TolA-binding protein
MSEPTKYAAFVAPELSKARLDAQWARISERRSPERKGRHPAIPAVGLLVAACAFGVVWWPRESRSTGESVWEGSVVASDDAPVEMTLAEGTRIQVDPRSEVKLLHSSARAVQVRLAHGSARFDVAKRRSRRFSVDLGRVEVVVTGTQFRVLRKDGPAGDRIQVTVEEGSVEVRRPDSGVVALHAGENWSTVIPREQIEPSADEVSALEETRAEAGQETPEAEEDDDELYEADVRSHAEARTSTARVKGVEGAEVTADDQLDHIDEDSAERSSRRRAISRERRRRRVREAAVGAGELFDQANLARRAGSLELAAELYDDLVAQYPRDRRASLAAFELGRLRMDSLRDPRGAVQALERALKLDGHGEFAEDALARLVLAAEARGERESCLRAQQRYLTRYPDGVHSQHVTERCGGQ